MHWKISKDLFWKIKYKCSEKKIYENSGDYVLKEVQLYVSTKTHLEGEKAKELDILGFKVWYRTKLDQ